MEAEKAPREETKSEKSDSQAGLPVSESVVEKTSILNGDNAAENPKQDKVLEEGKRGDDRDEGGWQAMSTEDAVESELVEAEDISNDINRNLGRKRKASSDLVSGDEGAAGAKIANVEEKSSLNPTELEPGLNVEKELALEMAKDESLITDSSDLNIPPKQTLGKGKRARIPNKRYSDIILSPNQRTKSTENGEKLDNLEENLIKPEPIAVSSPAQIHNKKLKMASDPLFLEPFKYGWKRELVWRANSQDRIHKTPGDIYYYMPSGKKMKSMREISENISNTELTMENFTFMKEPLGVDDPEKEIIRDAKKPKKLHPKGSRYAKSARSHKKKVVVPIVTQDDPNETAESLLAKTRASPRNLGNFKIKAPIKSKSDKKGKVENKPAEEIKEAEPATLKNSGSRKSGRYQNKTEANKPCQLPCSIRCEGVQGIVPTLQCRICLCLYHHECVGFAPHPPLPYVCKNCHLEDETTTPTGETSPINTPPPLTPINTLKSATTQPPALPKLQRIPEQQEFNPNIDPEMPKLTPRPIQTTASNKQTSENRLLQPPLLESIGRSLVGSVTTWLPHNSKIVDSIQRSGEEPMEARRPQYLEFLGGRKFLVIPKHNFMSVSPTVAVTADRRAEVTHGSVPDAVESANVDGGFNAEARVDPESPSKPESSQTPEVSMDVPEASVNTGGGLDASVDNREVEDEEKLQESASESKRRPSKPINNIATSEVKDNSLFMANYLQNVSYGYKTLLCVFQYLKVQDLLRAGCVCTMWRDIASHSQLWRTVRMKNSQVHSFDGLANTLKKHGTIHLDLRKMLLPGGDEIWPQFSKAIEKVDTLRKIELCRCPALVVEQLASSNPQLEIINAVTIKCESMSLEPLTGLKNIRELRLKSTQGLILTSNIDSLKNLKSLSHLSLTSIRELNTLNLGVIAELVGLESLDLGECTDFPKNFGEDILSKLENLERLRLEKGQGNCHTFEILDIVKSMKKLEQLELVNFDIKSGFDKALGVCSNVKKLLIIPTYISQSATTNHMVLGGVLRLQKTLSHFVWGVTLELLRVTELFVDQCEEPADNNDKKKEKKKPGNGDSIPVLKPVPLLLEKDGEIPVAHDPPQVEILPLPNLQKLLLQSLPSTRVKILKIPFHATWRQSITDSVS